MGGFELAEEPGNGVGPAEDPGVLEDEGDGGVGPEAVVAGAEQEQAGERDDRRDRPERDTRTRPRDGRPYP